MNEKKDTGRNANIDLIRTLCTLFVIMIHTTVKPFGGKPLAYNTLLGGLLVSNGIFYLMSGRLNLAKEFHSGKEIITFYKKKIVSIFIPYILISIALSFADMYAADEKDWSTFFVYTYKNIMMNNISIHLWFMYCLTGFYLSVPFFSKFLHGSSDDELKILFWLAMGWNAVYVYLNLNFGIAFMYQGWILEKWAFIFVMGYMSTRLINDKNKKFFYLAGVIGFAVSVLGQTYIPEHFTCWADLNPGFQIFIIAFFTFLEKEIRIKSDRVKRFLSFNAKYSFLIYLLHWHVLHGLAPKIIKTEIGWLHFTVSTVFTYCVSLLLAILLENLFLRYVKKIVSRILKLNA